MLPTQILRSQYGLQSEGRSGIQTWRQSQPYYAYKSPHGPNYKIQPHFHGINLTFLKRWALTGSLFGASAGIFALFFFDGVPRVQKDILQKIPFIGGFFHNEVPPEDNPF